MAYGYGVYFTERGKNRVVRWEPDSGKVDIVAGEPADEDPGQTLSDPYGLAFEKDGSLLIADKLNHRICRLKNGKLKPIALKDTDGHRARKPDSRRSYNPELLSPTGLFLEQGGTLLCSFSDDYTIYRIYPDGRLELVIGMLRNRNYHFTETREKVPPPEVMDTPINGPVGLVKRSDGTIFFIERRPQVLRQYHPSRGLECVFPLPMAQEWSRKDQAPAQALIADYHPAFPGSLALDAQENLYMTDVRHGCVLLVDLAKRTIRRVINLTRPKPEDKPGLIGGGCSAIGFGPDGTAWVLDSANGLVQGYRPQPSGEWTPTMEKLDQIDGKALKLPVAGSGITIGA